MEDNLLELKIREFRQKSMEFYFKEEKRLRKEYPNISEETLDTMLSREDKNNKELNNLFKEIVLAKLNKVLK